MSYKDDEEIVGDVDINEDDVDILAPDEDLDDPLLVDDDLLGDDDILGGDDEEELEEFAGLDGSEY
ncbi:MAG: hypothetical protein UR85_C0002G0053 [Candidatus Nomurabacteria bacterium GW2011_GWF2_35_66]|uniref:Uncharacterized protein n=1 Tax=Candidatus Nomurabacteria bacterium GW2011_GWE1_35_16 TaxID=1618761 RepID=A0A0G0EHA8_9BACT|nr:MAG: hypothetical protein UR55_C0004G0013 [Candidatus Nomurabacteria bacterium GW2011_GWF1_34_20]KKP63452.1 MAG: hypothetical protein UR57_C0004G0013 [Candidatus Nomurabacteria bacterium GW2011_GWE2_34_25]KKP66632.1 MAG: hypothetical protein UR64_C0004G0013 [Candidatus Nomurabacteria bacterium GW2011_GWE1_35_16]KKP83740.1 MAG: hypothetical protein UR85_C0002G0053 [Candidatus Nomurabacteria bacterium GW2011_GWF2_35_66]HAE36429.1 hypothetical protein [Candidatus Nomurabacteria bacterium]